MKNPIIIAAAVALIVGAGAFFGGMKFQETKASTNNGQGQTQVRGGNPEQGGDHAQGGQDNFRGGGGRPVSGEILNLDDESLTVKMEDGSSKIVLFSDSTEISRTQTAQKTELKTGERVAAFGTENSDGSITARNIQINPQFRGMDEQNRSPNPSPR